MARGKRHLIKLRQIPSVKYNPAIRWVGDDGIKALTQLVNRLVKQNLLSPVLGKLSDDFEAPLLRIINLRSIGCRYNFVCWPLPPLNAVPYSVLPDKISLAGTAPSLLVP